MDERFVLVPSVVKGERVLLAERAEVESDTKAKIRAALERIGVLVWNNPVGAGKLRSGRWCAFGLCKGSADLIGLVPPYGRFIGIETKRPVGGTPSHDQLQWIELVRSMKGVAGLASTVEQAIALANEARGLP